MPDPLYFEWYDRRNTCDPIYFEVGAAVCLLRSCVGVKICPATSSPPTARLPVAPVMTLSIKLLPPVPVPARRPGARHESYTMYTKVSFITNGKFTKSCKCLPVVSPTLSRATSTSVKHVRHTTSPVVSSVTTNDCKCRKMHAAVPTSLIASTYGGSAHSANSGVATGGDLTESCGT